MSTHQPYVPITYRSATRGQRRSKQKVTDENRPLPSSPETAQPPAKPKVKAKKSTETQKTDRPRVRPPFGILQARNVIRVAPRIKRKQREGANHTDYQVALEFDASLPRDASESFDPQTLVHLDHAIDGPWSWETAFWDDMTRPRAPRPYDLDAWDGFVEPSETSDLSAVIQSRRFETEARDEEPCLASIRWERVREFYHNRCWNELRRDNHEIARLQSTIHFVEGPDVWKTLSDGIVKSLEELEKEGLVA